MADGPPPGTPCTRWRTPTRPGLDLDDADTRLAAALQLRAGDAGRDDPAEEPADEPAAEPADAPDEPDEDGPDEE
jgi:hypothetical protein